MCSHLFCSALQSRAERAAAQAKQSMWFFSFVNCGFWGIVSWGAPDGPLRVDGSSWCELPPLTLIYCWVLEVRFMRGAGWATESWWWLLMWAASSHSHLLLGSGGSFYEGRWMGHWELMVALDVSCLLLLSFTLGLWGFILWGAPDGPLWDDGGSGCELPPLTLFYFRVLGIRFMRGANTPLSFFLYLLFSLRLTSLFSYIQIHLFIQNTTPCTW